MHHVPHHQLYHHQAEDQREEEEREARGGRVSQTGTESEKSHF